MNNYFLGFLIRPKRLEKKKNIFLSTLVNQKEDFFFYQYGLVMQEIDGNDKSHN